MVNQPSLLAAVLLKPRVWPAFFRAWRVIRQKEKLAAEAKARWKKKDAERLAPPSDYRLESN
jgi:hypothetical protein